MTKKRSRWRWRIWRVLGSALVVFIAAPLLPLYIGPWVLLAWICYAIAPLFRPQGRAIRRWLGWSKPLAIAPTPDERWILEHREHGPVVTKPGSIKFHCQGCGATR